jgi:hypothetical protein
MSEFLVSQTSCSSSRENASLLRNGLEVTSERGTETGDTMDPRIDGQGLGEVKEEGVDSVPPLLRHLGECG